MRNKLYSLLFLLFAAVSNVAFAWEDIKINVDGKNITITDIDHSIFSSEKKLSTSGDAASVYVQVDGKNIQRIVRERFDLAGVHTVDRAEDATMTIIFLTTGSISMPNVDKAAEHSALLNQQQILDNVTPVAGAVAAIGGGVGGIGYLAGFLFESNVKLIGSVETKEGHVGNVPMFDFKLEKGKEASDDTVFKALVDQWIRLYISFHEIDVAKVKS